MTSGQTAVGKISAHIEGDNGASVLAGRQCGGCCGARTY
jgi:hypothetical protein